MVKKTYQISVSPEVRQDLEAIKAETRAKSLSAVVVSAIYAYKSKVLPAYLATTTAKKAQPKVLTADEEKTKREQRHQSLCTELGGVMKNGTCYYWLHNRVGSFAKQAEVDYLHAGTITTQYQPDEETVMRFSPHFTTGKFIPPNPHP